MKHTLCSKHLWLSCLILVGLYSGLQAQDVSSYSLKGIIIDSVTGKPLEFTTLHVLDDQANPINAAISDSTGSFSISGLNAQKYDLVVQILGYHTKKISIDLSQADGQKTLNIRAVGMSPEAINLKETLIVAPRMLIKQELGQISYDMQADPQSKSSSLLEIMRKVPYLSVDGDGNILLKGNSSFRILINGKPSSMMERNPKEVLRSIPASTIVKVEVITSPPPKYEAEGLAGLINIVTTKRVSNGYNGTLNVYHRFPVGGPGLGTSFAFKEGKFAFNGYAGGSINNTPNYTNTLDRQTLSAESTALAQAGNREIDNKSGYVGAELSWDIDTVNLLSGQVNFNGSDSKTAYGQSSTLNAQTGLIERYDLLNNIDYLGNGMDAALNFQHSFPKHKSRLLTFSYRYMQFRNNNKNALGFSNRFNFDQADFRQANDERFGENTAQIDYVQPSKSMRVELGAKAIWRDNASDFNYSSFNSSTGQFEQVPAFSNAYNYLQDVYALYNSYTVMREKWGILGGFRVEQTNTRANFISTNTNVKQEFFNVIPSIMFNYNLSEGNSFNFGFVQRIRRPSIVRINPYVDRSNPNLQTTGNPNLVPVLLNDVQLGYSYSKKVSINVGLGYSFFNRLDLRVYNFDPSTNITRVTFANVGRGNRIGVDMNINYPISEKVNFSMNGSIAQFTIKGETDNTLFNNEWLTFSAASSLNINLEKGWRANIDLNINSRNPNSLQGSTNGFVTSGFSINKELAKGKLVLSGNVNNPFTKYRDNIIEVEGAGFEEKNLTREYFRSFNFSLNYRFGQSKGNVNKSRRNIRNDDVSNRSNM